METHPLPAATAPATGASAGAIDTTVLQTLFGAMPRGMVYGRLETTGDAPAGFTVLYFNAAYSALCGDAVIGQRTAALPFSGTEHDEALLQALVRVVQHGETPTFERYVAHLGKWLLMDLHSPNPGHFILLVSDVSSKRRAEAEVAASEKRLQAIFEICPVPFCLNDTQGNITFLNKSFRETFGYTVDDIPTLDAWWPLAYPEPDYREWVGKAWLERVDKARREGRDFETMEVIIRCKDGSRRTVLAQAVPLGTAFVDIHLVVLYDITDQKLAALSIAEADHYAQRILDSVGDGLCRVDLNGVVTFINPCGAELLGYQPEEIVGQHAHSLFHHTRADGSHYPASECSGHMALKLGRAFSVDNEVFWRRDGSSFDVHYTSAPMRVAGEVQGEVLTFRDTSEEVRIRQALLNNEVVIRKAQELAGLGTYVLDAHTGLWESSPQLDALFGIGPDFVRDVAGWNQLIDPEFRQLATDHLELVMRGNVDFRLDYRITRPSDGAKRWVAGNGEVEFDAHGKPLRMVGSIQDITARKRIEAELQESHDLLQKLSQEIPGVLFQFMMNPEGKFSAPFASEGVRDMFGLTPDEVWQDASQVFDAVVPEGRDAFVQSVLRSARTLNTWAEEFQVDIPGRGRHWRQGQARPESLPDGSVVWHGFISDATERVAFQHQLQQLNESLESRVLERTRELAVALDSAELAKRSRGQFLANVSHEIRTPMNAIMGMVYMAIKNEPTAQQQEYLEKIQRSGTHLLNIINDILDFSKIDAGKLELDVNVCDVQQLLQQVVHMGEGKAHEKDLSLALEVAPEVPRFIRCDGLRVGQILINFLNNASKFTQHGRITLRVGLLRDPASTDQSGTCQLSFEVEDSGIGMESEQIARLFRAFEQGDNSTTRRFGGTGLGLAICRQLAYLMGGEVGAVSAPNVGSTFWFVCRFETAESPAPQEEWDTDPVHAIAALRGKRVLVVDDNDFNQEVASDLLSDVGVEVALASHGAQALEALHGGHFDAVLMDVQMPVMDGHEATRRIRSDPALAQTIVLAMTANAGAEDRERCLAAGMNEVLTKPIDPDLLFVTLAHWIARPQGAARSHSHGPSHSPSPIAAPSVVALPAEPVAAPQIPPVAAVAEGLPVWDPSALQRIVGDNQATQTRLLDKYLLTAGETITGLREAASAAHWPQAGELAHKLKSSSRSVGAMRLGALCEALEREGRAGSPGTSQALVALVIQGFSEVETRIRSRAV